MRGAWFGTDSYHYAVTPDGELIKNEDAFKPQISNAEAMRNAAIQNAWSRRMWEQRKERNGMG